LEIRQRSLRKYLEIAVLSGKIMLLLLVNSALDAYALLACAPVISVVFLCVGAIAIVQRAFAGKAG
jgi:hypothetical protein